MANQTLVSILSNGKDKSTLPILFSIIFVIIGSVCVVISLFPPKLGNISVDYFAFAAGILLITDALYKLRTDLDKPWSCQIVRLCRLIIGVCIFAIHAMQYIYKV
jgi:hypothetical protein